MSKSVYIVILSLISLQVNCQQPPNIIFIVADDLGWNDVGWHNNEVRTPNLDDLARKGVILNQSYVQPYCSPSRSSFLTGLYPFHVGLQHVVVSSVVPGGVPLNVTMLPELLRNQGYATHMIGKWHLGFCKWEYTPRWRGFDTFMGFYSAEETYYDRTVGPSEAFDFRHNETSNRTYNGVYSTELYAQQAVELIQSHQASKPMFLYLAFQAVHAPLEVPERYLSAYQHITDRRRRLLCGMVSALDEAVGNITRALDQQGLLSNTILVFTSDNGAPVYFGGSNWPLRGAKGTLWEGGVRVPAFAYSPLFHQTGFVSDALFHATDWFTTLLSFAGLQNTSAILPYSLDGVDQSQVITNNAQSNRSTLVYNINEFTGASAIRSGDYKLIVGYAGSWDTVYSAQADASDHLSGFNLSMMGVANFFENADVRTQVQGALERKSRLSLFDLAKDPFESLNLADSYPLVVQTLLDQLLRYNASLLPIKFQPRSDLADPKHWNNTVSPGWCLDSTYSTPKTASIAPSVLISAASCSILRVYSLCICLLVVLLLFQSTRLNFCLVL